jgi:mRNA interferase RelE/StbE
VELRYAVFVAPDVHDQRRELPGIVRQRVQEAIEELSTSPRPATSTALDVSGIDTPQGVEVRRIRLERWRIVYAVNEAEQWVVVLALRRRPPYDYDDLRDLTTRL